MAAGPGPTRYAVASDGVHLAYSVTGTGPALLGIGDWWGHIERDWELPPLRDFWARMASFAQLVLFDVRGTSLSDPLPPGTTPSLERCVEDIIAVLDAAEVERVTVFVGAAATPLGLLFASMHPERTASLVIYNGYARFLSVEDQPFGLPADSLAGFKAMVADNWGAESIVLLAAPGTNWTPDVLRAAAANMRFTAAPTTALSLLPLLYESDVRDLLPKTRVPSIVLHAKLSPLVPIEHGRYLAAALPKARFRELPGRDHYFWGEDAELIGDELQNLLTGTHGRIDVDRVLTTMLFSDVVDSTGRAVRLGDRQWGHLLDEFEAATRNTLQHYRGREVKATGDGFLACFDGPTNAVQCGLALRDSALAVGVELRVGIHTGEVDLRDGDLGGVAVHIAARIQEAARPSEILTSRTVVDVVLGSGISFEPRGAHTLKGLPGSWQLFSAGAATTDPQSSSG